MSSIKGLVAFACAALLCGPGIACVLPDSAPLPKERRKELIKLLSESNVPARAVTDTYHHRLADPGRWSAAAVVDIGMSPDGAYRRRHLRCDYTPGKGWICEEEIARYLREGQRLIGIDKRLSAADAKLILQKIQSLVGTPSVLGESNIPLDESLVREITHLYVEIGGIRAVIAGGCGTEIRFAGQCRKDRICNLRYVTTSFIM